MKNVSDSEFPFQKSIKYPFQMFPDLTRKPKELLLLGILKNYHPNRNCVDLKYLLTSSKIEFDLMLMLIVLAKYFMVLNQADSFIFKR